jgi:hypothetical protein
MTVKHLYAHAVIEDPDTGKRYQRGDEVPDDLPGIDRLKKAGSVSSKKHERVSAVDAVHELARAGKDGGK